MTETIKDKLRKVIDKFREVDFNTYMKNSDYYLRYLVQNIEGCRDEAVQYAIKQFWDNQLWDKSLSYFQAICINREKEIIGKINKEKKSLGGIPTDAA